MIIKNGRVFQEDGTFAEKDLYIEGKRFVSTKEEVIDQEVIDAKGMMVLPGLVDVHSHGAAGHDFSDGDVEGLKEILRYEKAHGITSYCPTSMTLPKDDLLKIFRTIAAGSRSDRRRQHGRTVHRSDQKRRTGRGEHRGSER